MVLPWTFCGEIAIGDHSSFHFCQWPLRISWSVSSVDTSFEIPSSYSLMGQK